MATVHGRFVKQYCGNYGRDLTEHELKMRWIRVIANLYDNDIQPLIKTITGVYVPNIGTLWRYNGKSCKIAIGIH